MSSKDRASGAALALLSTVMLAYEVVQIRTFSFSLHPLVAFSALSIALLGLGLGSLLPGLYPRWAEGNRLRRVALASLGLAVSLGFSNLLFAHASDNIVVHETLQVRPFWLVLVLLPTIVPYGFCGLSVTLLLQGDTASTGRRYFWNLAGSALGCVLAAILLRPAGAERIVIGCTAVSFAVAAGLLAFAQGQEDRKQRWLCWACTALALLCVAVLPVGPSVLPYQPDANELIYKEASEGRDRFVREFTEWDPVGRIDVLKHGPETIQIPESVAFRSITNDSGAMTLLIQEPPVPGWGKALFEESIYSLAYRARGGTPEVLVIGVGGGTDIQTALRWNASHVTGVEISLSSLRVVTGRYADFAGWPRHTDKVSVFHGDGRSFAKSTRQRFDVVQMSGVDTITMHSASAMVTAEDRLYTIEAFVDLLNLLKPGGVLAVIRFGDEAMNLAAIASVALQRQGIPTPEKHIVASRQAWMSGILVQREPFSEEQLERLRRIEDRQTPSQVRIPHYDSVGVRLGDPVELLHPAGRKGDPRYQKFFELAGGSPQQALAQSLSPFLVPEDDRPYYMLGIWLSMSGPSGSLMIRHILANLFIAVLSLALIILPALTVHRKLGIGAAPVKRTLAYFFALGLGFMLIEVGLVHRVIVFVGNPGAAVSVVLASLLLASGVGSQVSDRLAGSDRRRVLLAFIGLLLVGLGYVLVLGRALEQLHGLSMTARSLSAGLLLLPAGFFLGWFFPIGLRVAGAHHGGLVAWSIAVNSFASVLGSLVLLPLSMTFGFRAVFVFALFIYGFAVLLFVGIGTPGKTVEAAKEQEHG